MHRRSSPLSTVHQVAPPPLSDHRRCRRRRLGSSIGQKGVPNTGDHRVGSRSVNGASTRRHRRRRVYPTRLPPARPTRRRRRRQGRRSLLSLFLGSVTTRLGYILVDLSFRSKPTSAFRFMPPPMGFASRFMTRTFPPPLGFSLSLNSLLMGASCRRLRRLCRRMH